MTFSDLGVNRKVVSNGLFYINMKFQLISMFQNQENGQKLSKSLKKTIFDDFEPILNNEDDFSARCGYLESCRYWSYLSKCAISADSYASKSRKRPKTSKKSKKADFDDFEMDF